MHTGVCAFEDNTVDEEKDKSSVKVVYVRALRLFEENYLERIKYEIDQIKMFFDGGVRLFLFE